MDSNMLSAQNSAWQIVMTSRQQIPAKCLPLTLALSSQSSVCSWGPLLGTHSPCGFPSPAPLALWKYGSRPLGSVRPPSREERQV